MTGGGTAETGFTAGAEVAGLVLRVRFEGRSSAAKEDEASEVPTSSELEVAPEGPPDWRCLNLELL